MADPKPRITVFAEFREFIARGNVIDLAVFTVEQRSVTHEISYADAQAANAKIRSERDEESLVRAPADIARKG